MILDPWESIGPTLGLHHAPYLWIDDFLRQSRIRPTGHGLLGFVWLPKMHGMAKQTLVSPTAWSTIVHSTALPQWTDSTLLYPALRDNHKTDHPFLQLLYFHAAVASVQFVVQFPIADTLVWNWPGWSHLE